MAMMTLLEIATLVDGMLIGVPKNVAEKVTISNVLPLDQTLPGTLTLLDNSRNAHLLVQCPASAAIVAESDVDAILKACKEKSPILVAVSDPHSAFERLIEAVRPLKTKPTPGIDARSAIGDNVQIGRDVSVGPYVSIAANCVIGDRTVLHAGVRLMADCVIGRDCELFPNAVLYPRTILEDRILVHGGVVLGGFGFGYRQVEGRHQRTAQLGWTHIESDAEIGANSTIDRGTYGATKVGVGTKIDNLVQVGHNVRVGPHNLICSQAGIAGSASTGSHVVLGGQVGVRDHIHLGDRCMAGAQSGIVADVPAESVVVGSPAAPRKESLQSMLALQRLPEMRKQLRQLQSEVENLLKLQSKPNDTKLNDLIIDDDVASGIKQVESVTRSKAA